MNAYSCRDDRVYGIEIDYFFAFLVFTGRIYRFLFSILEIAFFRLSQTKAAVFRVIFNNFLARRVGSGRF
jgi:hypothetical protein